MLKIGGFEVAGIAEDGEEAVTMFKAFLDKPKVILMDNRMPNKSGIEATKEILLVDKNIKIIFVSADITIKEEAISIGAFSFWDKPFSIESLIIDINKAFESYNFGLASV